MALDSCPAIYVLYQPRRPRRTGTFYANGFSAKCISIALIPSIN